MSSPEVLKQRSDRTPKLWLSIRQYFPDHLTLAGNGLR